MRKSWKTSLPAFSLRIEVKSDKLMLMQHLEETSPSLNPQEVPSCLEPYPVVYQTQIRWGDMDAYGHLNNTKYFMHFEDARIKYLERLDIAFSGTHGLGVVVAQISCRFKRPLKYPEKILVGTRISHLDESRFAMDYLIYSSNQQKIAALGESLLVTVHLDTFERAKIPESIADKIRQFEKNPHL